MRVKSSLASVIMHMPIIYNIFASIGRTEESWVVDRVVGSEELNKQDHELRKQMRKLKIFRELLLHGFTVLQLLDEIKIM